MMLTPSMFAMYLVSQICGCVSSYYELRRCRPKLEKLNILLNESAYKGQEFEQNMDEDGPQRVSFNIYLYH